MSLNAFSIFFSIQVARASYVMTMSWPCHERSKFSPETVRMREPNILVGQLRCLLGWASSYCQGRTPDNAKSKFQITISEISDLTNSHHMSGCCRYCTHSKDDKQLTIICLGSSTHFAAHNGIFSVQLHRNGNGSPAFGLRWINSIAWGLSRPKTSNDPNPLRPHNRTTAHRLLIHLTWCRGLPFSKHNDKSQVASSELWQKNTLSCNQKVTTNNQLYMYIWFIMDTNIPIFLEYHTSRARSAILSAGMGLAKTWGAHEETQNCL